jgi:hypothetical protein
MVNPLQKEEFENPKSGIQGERRAETSDDPTDLRIDRASSMNARDEDDPSGLQREIEKLDAEMDEEIDALRLNLMQDDELDSTRDGSGKVVDDLAEQKIARFTEVGPMVGDRGAISVTPGRDNPSRILRSHHPNAEIARPQDLMEANLDEPGEESRIERQADEGTAA